MYVCMYQANGGCFEFYLRARETEVAFTIKICYPQGTFYAPYLHQMLFLGLKATM